MGRPISPLLEGSSKSTTVKCALMVEAFDLVTTVKSNITTPTASIVWPVKSVNGVCSSCIRLRDNLNLSKVRKYKMSNEFPVSTNMRSIVKFEIMGAITTGSSCGNSMPSKSLSEKLIGSLFTPTRTAIEYTSLLA
ncbi:hypothetical protein LIER_40629 [Lithospermum erythrorhizon]|uniref:Uncharacterized protein n=1 Tax=Lithospermum erythrorhizon TaxID=34254 RepID=A0AAV3QXK2_LITER